MAMEEMWLELSTGLRTVGLGALQRRIHEEEWC